MRSRRAEISLEIQTKHCSNVYPAVFCGYKMSHTSSALESEIQFKATTGDRWQGDSSISEPQLDPTNTCNTRSLAACMFIRQILALQHCCSLEQLVWWQRDSTYLGTARVTFTSTEEHLHRSSTNVSCWKLQLSQSFKADISCSFSCIPKSI